MISVKRSWRISGREVLISITAGQQSGHPGRHVRDYGAVDAYIAEQLSSRTKELIELCSISSEAADPGALLKAREWVVGRL
jgi:hypothetical protein